MNESPVTPLEYSVCYMKGTEYGPQAILQASSQIKRRVVEMGIPLTEIGIRSFSPEEAEFMKTRPVLSDKINRYSTNFSRIR